MVRWWSWPQRHHCTFSSSAASSSSSSACRLAPQGVAPLLRRRLLLLLLLHCGGVPFGRRAKRGRGSRRGSCCSPRNGHRGRPPRALLTHSAAAMVSGVAAAGYYGRRRRLWERCRLFRCAWGHTTTFGVNGNSGSVDLSKPHNSEDHEIGARSLLLGVGVESIIHWGT